MLTTAFVNINSFFYPIGNTTAACLTQDLSPEQRGNILLLGCGDARNILFTSYSENSQNTRKIDITACDFQKAVIARNIVLFTLLIDDTSGSNSTAIWNIYYHFNLDEESIKLLQVQSKKLCKLSTTIQSWEASVYGRLLRFCDTRSLSLVREVWYFYSKASEPGGDREGFNKSFKADCQNSIKWRQRLMGDSAIGNGIRSAAPAIVDAMKELPKFNKHYWNHGITEESQHKISKAQFSNPMFATMEDDSSILHYGTDPLSGFHLATAYMPLSLNSTLRPKFNNKVTSCKAVHAAQAQFQAWSAAFRMLALQKKVTIRFVVADALAFCHTLQHRATSGECGRANWYSGQYTLEPLIIDGEDYKNGTAPRTFNVIDTSNLADHLGIVNVLLATTPLLESSSCSSIYTELLVKQAEGAQALAETLLCGHFTTMSTLLGLYPAEYFSNATAISNADAAIMEVMMGKDPKDLGQQMHRLVWKRSSPCPASQGGVGELDRTLNFREDDLAHLLYQAYRVMFQHEDLARLYNKGPMANLVYYHRGSFASLLRHVKNISVVQWDNMMGLLINLIKQDTSSLVGLGYFQELCTHLYLLDLYTSPSLVPGLDSSVSRSKAGLGSWTEIPTIVCLTLKIPRASLQKLTNIPVRELSTPLVHSIIESSPELSYGFCAVQLSFGKLSMTGDRNDDLELQIREDGLGWKGTSPLLVSFYVPSNVLLQEPSATKVSFGFQINPQNLMLLGPKFGIGLKLFEASLSDQEHVYITRHLPNQQGYPSICCRKTFDSESEGIEKTFRTTITADVSHATGQIASFTGRIDFISQALQSALAGTATVKNNQISPRIVEITVGDNDNKHLLYFPTPVLNSQAKIRIARKSSYVEIIVPMSDHAEGTGFSHSMHPIFISHGVPVLWNMPFLNLDSLPIISTAKKEDIQWLTPAVSLQMSAKEYRSKEYDMANPGYVQTDVRINFKESLFSMFMTFAGLQTEKIRYMGLTHPGRGGVNVLILISELRFDMGNRTAILDAAVLALTHDIVQRINKFLSLSHKLPKNLIKVDDEELDLWKETLPAYIERCRTWKHLPTCEYKLEGKIPMTTEYAKPFLCSCGNGSVPPDFIKGIPGFNTISKYMVRAAISPSYAVPFVENMYSMDDVKLKSDEVKTPNSEQCGNCEKTRHAEGRQLLVCSRCRRVKYCSAECQKAHWKVHKKTCVKVEVPVKAEENGGVEGKDDKDLSALIEAMEAEALD